MTQAATVGTRVGFADGLMAPARGLAFLLAHPRLLRLAIVPMLLHLLITIALLTLGLAGVIFAAVRLHGRYPDAWWGIGLEIVVIIAMALAAAGVGVALANLIGSALCDGYHRRLALEVDLALGLPRPERLDEPSEGLAAAVKMLAINLGLVLLHLVPIVGSIAALLLGCYLDGRILGANYLEMPMRHRGIDKAGREAFFQEHRDATLGLGAAVLLLTMIPIAGALLLATPAAGAVLLYRAIEQGPRS